MPKKNKSTCKIATKLLTLDEAIEHAQSCVNDTPCGQNHRQLAEWLIELDRFRTTPIGNICALRMALIKAHTMLKVCDWPEGVDMNGVANLMKEIETVIVAPARNCDVGTVDDQRDRFLEFCDVAKCSRGHYCRLCNSSDCELAWAQLPYEKGGTDGSK